MAVAAPALHHHLRLRFSNPITRTRPSLPGGATAFLTHLQIHQNSARISLISCSSTSQSTEANTDTPESCVNLGLQLFSKGRVKDALVQFETALSLDPNPIEAQAALYNKACCHAYKGEGRKAADCLRTALREYDLKFGTILNDPDLASFRALPEFKELQEEARLGGEDIGYSFRRDLKLISEVQAPFRGIRRFFYVAFSAAAGISTFFTVPRLFRAFQGGDDAPDLWETAGNVAVNVGAAALPSIGEDFEKRTQSITAKSKLKAEIRFRAEVESPGEWERWIKDQQKSEGVTPGEDVYIILRLDGRVRRSGKGMPDWQQIVQELPPIEALLSKLER
ncbi:hypothetical protein C1H46_019373 [Malus baccata]|uniref:Uncharacterized protein n=1 Tax=Malus baccata TaxID=106549 RepID=A0A540M8M8_MALBA|nr:hypothetical protein C1H46_019373 [Malus baccata]